MDKDEYLRAVTIGEIKPLASRITLADYDPDWPRQFEREEACVRAVLGERVLQLEHAGSTSVPGLLAKPVIDMLLTVADSSDESAYVPDMERAGYVLRTREPDWYQHRVLKGPATNINLHVFTAGCPEIERMLRFRNWLRAHPNDRDVYAGAKRELAVREWKYVQNYADAKTAVIEEILARASTTNE